MKNFEVDVFSQSSIDTMKIRGFFRGECNASSSELFEFSTLRTLPSRNIDLKVRQANKATANFTEADMLWWSQGAV